MFDSSQDLNACPHLRGRASGACSAVCVPVSFMGRALGVLHTTGPAGTPLPAEKIAQLTTLAGQAGARIGTVRAFEKTQLQASTDGLTGLVNRRTLEKKLRGLFMTAAGNSGNAASRVESFIQSKGDYAYGGYPDIDDLFAQQAGERDVKKREALLHQIQQLTIDRAMYAPVMDLRTLNGIGPRIARHTITDVWMSPFPSYEDVELK